jgi:hypothetical protein
MLQNREKFKKGIALYLTILILGLLFAIGMGLSLLVFTQIKVIKETGYSVNALSAADSGVERALYEMYVNGVISGTFQESIDNASFTVEIIQASSLECPSPPFNWYCIKSKGEFKNIFRFVEAAY